MLLTVIKVVVAVWAIEVTVVLVAYAWDRLGFRRDQRRALARLSAYEQLEAAWRLDAWDPWERRS